MALTITETLPLISLAGNPMKVKIHTDNLFNNAVRRYFYTLILNIYDENNVLLKELSAEPDDSGDAWFNLDEAFTGIKPTIASPFDNVDFNSQESVVADATACKKFYFKLAEGYGVPYVEQAESVTSGNFYVIPGGLPDWYLRKLDTANSTFYAQLLLSNIWLTNQPNVKTVFTDQPEQLRFLHLNAAQQNASLVVERLDHDGAVTTETLWTGTLEPYTIYTVLASPDFAAESDTVKYTLYMVVGSTKITTDATFILDNAKPENTRYVFFRNSLGSFDCAALTGKMVSDLETMTVDFVTPEISKIREALMPGQERAEGIRYLTGSIGWKSGEELEWLSELLLSETRYLVAQDNDLETIIISPDRRSIGNDSFAPKTFNIEAVIGVNDFFFLGSD